MRGDHVSGFLGVGEHVSRGGHVADCPQGPEQLNNTMARVAALQRDETKFTAGNGDDYRYHERMYEPGDPAVNGVAADPDVELAADTESEDV